MNANINMSQIQAARRATANISYPCAAVVVFCGHLYAQAAFRLDRKSPAVRLWV